MASQSNLLKVVYEKNKENKKYETIYRRNKSTGRVIIDIALDDYIEFFMSGIILRLKARYSSRTAEFLDLCSEDISLREKLEINFSLNTAGISKEKEELIRISYHNYYNSLKRLSNRKTKRFFKLSAVLLFISLSLLSLYTLLANRIQSKAIISNVSLKAC